MCKYTNVHKCIYMNMHWHTTICIDLYACIKWQNDKIKIVPCVHLCSDIRLHIWIWTYMYVLVSVSVSVYIYIYIHVYMDIYMIHPYLYLYLYLFLYLFQHLYLYVIHIFICKSTGTTVAPSFLARRITEGMHVKIWPSTIGTITPTQLTSIKFSSLRWSSMANTAMYGSDSCADSFACIYVHVYTHNYCMYVCACVYT